MKGVFGLSATAFGLLTGFGIGIAATAVGGALEGPLGTIIVSWEMAGLIVTILAILGGAMMGSIGQMTARPLIGMVGGGLALSTVFASVALNNGCPTGVAVWTILVGLVTGTMSGGVGGWIGQRGRATSPTSKIGHGS